MASVKRDPNQGKRLAQLVESARRDFSIGDTVVNLMHAMRRLNAEMAEANELQPPLCTVLHLPGSLSEGAREVVTKALLIDGAMTSVAFLPDPLLARECMFTVSAFRRTKDMSVHEALALHMQDEYERLMLALADDQDATSTVVSREYVDSELVLDELKVLAGSDWTQVTVEFTDPDRRSRPYEPSAATDRHRVVGRPVAPPLYRYTATRKPHGA